MTGDTSLTVEVGNPAVWNTAPCRPGITRLTDALLVSAAQDRSLSDIAFGAVCVVASYLAEGHRQISVAAISDCCTNSPSEIVVCLRELADHGYVTLLAGAG